MSTIEEFAPTRQAPLVLADQLSRHLEWVVDEGEEEGQIFSLRTRHIVEIDGQRFTDDRTQQRWSGNEAPAISQLNWKQLSSVESLSSSRHFECALWRRWISTKIGAYPEALRNQNVDHELATAIAVSNSIWGGTIGLEVEALKTRNEFRNRMRDRTEIQECVEVSRHSCWFDSVLERV